jgi:hypothetical protein
MTELQGVQENKVTKKIILFSEKENQSLLTLNEIVC